MTAFSTVVTDPRHGQRDPSKHVNYTHGMVLGVDDLIQEFTYLSGRDQWLARDVIGYGTVCGLRVSQGVDADKGPFVQVEPGVALSPRGQLIQVRAPQCAYLDHWLQSPRHQPDVEARLARFPGLSGESLTLFVVLCYRECPTDEVPIPGEPCRTEDEALAPSRLTDDFRLELRFHPPDQREEDALRDFVAWLRQIEVSDSDPTSISREDFVAVLQAAALEVGSPPESPPESPPWWPVDFMFGTPPAMRINVAELCDYLRLAFRTWVTELRPRWYRADLACGRDPVGEECVLLAQLEVPLAGGPASREVAIPSGSAAPLVIDEERRPILLHLRLLQEWLSCGRLAAQGTPFSFSMPLPEAVAVPGDTVVPEQALDGSAASPGVAAEYSRSDHTHGTPPDPIPAHVADGAAHAGHGIDGDVTGTLAATRIQALQGKRVDAATPAGGQVLQFDGNADAWRAVQLPVTPVGGEFVDRPPGVGSYGIVAAGTVFFDTRNGAGNVVGTTYNGLDLAGVDRGAAQIQLRYDNPYPAPQEEGRYVVKVTPQVQDDDGRFTRIFSVYVVKVGHNELVLGAWFPNGPENRGAGSIMIEISQFLY
jgi:hypothetical protein